ncbi:MAG: NAD-dependent epimerase/dehydratase family protein [Kineosporiaceae bacterium]
MRIVVAGATGNLGTALLRALAGTGHEVVGVVRRPPPRHAEPYDRATWHALDLAADDAGPRLAEIASGADAIVNLVWGFQPSRRVDYLERVGVGGVRAVLAAAGRAGVPHVVQLSSVGAYSPGAYGLRVDESWPTSGAVDFSYSIHKAAAERLLDAAEQEHGDRPTITRIRPGLVLQRSAGSALLRYGAPVWFPGGLLRLAAVLPLDRRLQVPVVHSEDVADALVRVLERRAGGAFNLATEPPVTRDLLARVLGSRRLHVPSTVLASVTSAAWRARVQPLDPGWLELAFAVPLLDTTRARTELGWRPRWTAWEAVADAVAGIAGEEGTASPALRRRSVPAEIARAVRVGLPGNRRLT